MRDNIIQNLLLKKDCFGPFDKTYAAPVTSILEQGKYREIFSPDVIGMTIQHVSGQLSNPFFGLSTDQLEIAGLLLNDINSQAQNDCGALNEYTSTQNNATLTITKAQDFLSPDYHLSYNKASLQIDGITIEWYFLFMDNQTTVEGDNLKNVQKDILKPEILFEKSDSNKVEGYNRNNTGYKFWWSDGRVMDHGDVENFINKKRAVGDKQFLDDFPVVKEGEVAPSYTIVGRKQPYYAYDKRLKDPYEDGDNLKSTLLSGNYYLEQAYDGHIIIGTVSKGGSVNDIKRALNQIYADDKAFTPLVENGNYDADTIKAVKRFQVDNKLKSQNGNVGTETLHALDDKIAQGEAVKAKKDDLDDFETRMTKLYGAATAKQMGDQREWCIDNGIPVSSTEDFEAAYGEMKTQNLLNELDEFEARMSKLYGPVQAKAMRDEREYNILGGIEVSPIKDFEDSQKELDWADPNAGTFYQGVTVPHQTWVNINHSIPKDFVVGDNHSWDTYGTYTVPPVISTELPKNSKETNQTVFFTANDKITTDNAAAIMLGGFLAGTGPENYIYPEGHAVSASLSDANILDTLLTKWYAEFGPHIKKGVNISTLSNTEEYKKNYINKFVTFGGWDTMESIFSHGGPGNVESLIGSAAISLIPDPDGIHLHVKIYNTTSKGSGHLEKDMGLENEARSFPRNPKLPEVAQPYSNISQTYYLILDIKKDK